MAGDVPPSDHPFLMRRPGSIRHFSVYIHLSPTISYLIPSLYLFQWLSPTTARFKISYFPFRHMLTLSTLSIVFTLPTPDQTRPLPPPRPSCVCNMCTGPLPPQHMHHWLVSPPPRAYPPGANAFSSLTVYSLLRGSYSSSTHRQAREEGPFPSRVWSTKGMQSPLYFGELFYTGYFFLH